MISEIQIKDFKSVEELALPLGRVTVLIGENGSGKSNILEAISLLAAGLSGKLDNEFLISRGVRPINPELLLPAFPSIPKRKKKLLRLGIRSDQALGLTISISTESGRLVSKLLSPNIEISEDKHSLPDRQDFGSQDPAAPEVKNTAALLEILKPKISADKTGKGMTVSFELTENRRVPSKVFDAAKSKILEGLAFAVEAAFRKTTDKFLHTSSFLIFSPEVTALRRFEEEGQIQPIGIRGEGLFKLIQSFMKDGPEKLASLKQSMELIGWFSDFSIPSDLASGESRLSIKDRYVSSSSMFDQRVANEGFLFLLFYFTLFISEKTPKFFAIDNIDAALNPKLCAELMRRLCFLAKTHDKQVILTTHNPSILDGLDLSDVSHKLIAVSRDKEGKTKIRQIHAPKPQRGEVPIKISEAFTRGLIGGLPKNF